MSWIRKRQIKKIQVPPPPPWRRVPRVPRPPTDGGAQHLRVGEGSLRQGGHIGAVGAHGMGDLEGRDQPGEVASGYSHDYICGGKPLNVAAAAGALAEAVEAAAAAVGTTTTTTVATAVTAVETKSETTSTTTTTATAAQQQQRQTQ